MRKQLYTLTIGLFFISCGQSNNEPVTSAIRVQTEIVNISSSIQVHNYVGVIEEERSTLVSYSSIGTVSKLLVEEGTTVRKGELIAVIDNTQAKNIYQTTLAQYNQAQDALSRSKQLYEKKSLTDSKWVEIQSQVEQASAQLEMARKSLNDCELHAPCSGMIGKRHVDMGETVMPAQPIFSIYSINNVYVRVPIPEKEINRIHTNMYSIITVDASGNSCKGGKITKGIVADPVSHTYDIKIVLNNSEHLLLPGMVANVSIQPSNNETTHLSGISVPISSVQQNIDGSKFIWTIAEDMTAHRTPIRVGEISGNSIMILSGLNAGDRIVTGGYHKLSEGSRVVNIPSVNKEVDTKA